MHYCIYKTKVIHQLNKYYKVGGQNQSQMHARSGVGNFAFTKSFLHFFVSAQKKNTSRFCFFCRHQKGKQQSTKRIAFLFKQKSLTALLQGRDSIYQKLELVKNYLCVSESCFYFVFREQRETKEEKTKQMELVG